MIGRLAPILLVSLALSGCAERRVDAEIPFVATYGGDTLSCDVEDRPVLLTDLRLYVADVHALSAAGEWVPLAMPADGQWQTPSLALIDLESGTGNCANGTPAIHDSLIGTLPAGKYTALKFTVGVPFELNHGDPLQAEPPLGDAAMHWHWRGGYKFLRVGVETATDGFWLHLGSTGCEGSLQNITGCNAPNRVSIEISPYDFEKGAVAIDLGALLTGTSLDDGEISSCSSGPAETACAPVFDALGLAGANQTVFKALTP